MIGKAASRGKNTRWLCRCDCGNETTVWKHSLICGAQVSCGCYMREVSAKTGRQSATHGMRRSAEYSVWCGMLRRCRNSNDRSFPRYGGRGIEVRFSCFSEFYAAVGERPSSLHSIDRINPDGSYEAGNVRWALSAVQARNKRASLIFEIGEEKLPLKDWCERFDRRYATVWGRLKRGWSISNALEIGSLESRAHQMTSIPGLFAVKQ